MHVATIVQELDWMALTNRNIPAPFKPQIKNELDVSNFSSDFTSMVVMDSPAAVPLDGTKIFKVTCPVSAVIMFSIILVMTGCTVVPILC